MSNKFKYVKAKVYDATQPNFIFPENEDDSINSKENFGIAFSGGGTRSASLTMGQLRALNNIGILSKAKYMSAVSGGSWASLPFIFLDSNIKDNIFLGEYFDPKQITVSNLKETPDFSLAKAIANATFIDKILEVIDFGHDLYAEIVSKIILAPFNLGNNKKFFTLNQKSLNEILLQNPNLNAEDFYLVNTQNNRPFYIAGGTLLRPDFVRYQFEMSPLYVGVNNVFKNSGSNNRFDIGGGYIQPHGFNSDSPESIENNEVFVRLGINSNMFNLGDVVGVSGAAPAEYAERYGFSWVGFPEFKYWCQFDNPVETQQKEYEFGDGGILENLGIMPLLKRQVKKIILFVNCQTPLTGDDEKKEEITDSIPALFRKLNKKQYGSPDFDKNIVFANQLDKYEALVHDLKIKIENGHAPIHINKYKVTKQPHYNITEEYEVEIMWIYNAQVLDWKKQLNKDVKNLLNYDKMFDNFPYYKTFMQNPPKLIELKPEQTNLISQLSSWIITSNESMIKNFLK